jgi:hypothetical protein
MQEEPLIDPVIRAITAELERVEEDSQHSAASQFALAQQFRSVELVAGIPSTALAAVAGLLPSRIPLIVLLQVSSRSSLPV